jgi:hypothetical protein
MGSDNEVLEEKSYDLLAEIASLLEPVDVTDKVLWVRRAIRLHTLSVALYFPRLTQLEASRKGRAPSVDMITIARRHAAVKLYEHYASSKLNRNKSTTKTESSRPPISRGLSARFTRLRFLKEILALESGGLSILMDDLSLNNYVTLFSGQLRKSRAVALLIKAYVTNGMDLKNIDRNLNRRPLGFQTMRYALCHPIANQFKKSEVRKDS